MARAPKDLYEYTGAIRGSETLSANARHAGLNLALFMNRSAKGAFPSAATLAAEMGRNEKTARKAIKELERAGYLLIKRESRGSLPGWRRRYEGMIPTPADPEYSSALDEVDPEYFSASKREKRGENPDFGVLDPEQISAEPVNEDRETGTNVRQTIHELSNTQREAAHSIPNDFSASPEMRNWAANACPGVDVQGETAKFIDHSLANGRACVDWMAAWRKWVRQAAEYQKKKTPRTNHQIDQDPARKRRAELLSLAETLGLSRRSNEPAEMFIARIDEANGQRIIRNALSPASREKFNAVNFDKRALIRRLCASDGAAVERLLTHLNQADLADPEILNERFLSPYMAQTLQITPQWRTE